MSSVVAIIPFAIMLAAIAFLPLIVEHWWEKNRNKAIVSAILGIPVSVYVFLHEKHALEHAGLEYVQFLSLIATLFIVAGGVHVTGNLVARPIVNTTIMLVGYILASVIGTTGAAMLLIYPLLRSNQERTYKVHTVIFFIFTVCNIGGLLSPIGDPPLFLGYLNGIDFWWWLRNLWCIWVFTGIVLLGLFFLIDTYYYRKEGPLAIAQDIANEEPVRLIGWLNLVGLAVIVGSVAIAIPTPMREIIMWAVALLSLAYGQGREGAEARRENNFSFAPIIEVAVIFAGIFLTMIPVLQLLKIRGHELGVQTPEHYYWATGFFSSFLDNAPTFLCFLELGMSTQQVGDAETFASDAPELLAAISVGAVFFGAMTYIGNAPNFIVRSIAVQQGVQMPSFLGYMMWSGFCLLPVLLIVSFLLRIM